jgi:hypothetical protein
MLRRISIAVAAAAVLGLCAAPAFASQGAKHHPNSGSFTAPRATSAVKGWGNYHVTNAHRVHVQTCVQKTGHVFAVGMEAVAYNANYTRHSAIAAVILPETPGASHGVCTQMNLLYTAHLKVFTFIGQGGFITKKSPMKTIY